jgi:hypothetical protein
MPMNVIRIDDAEIIMRNMISRKYRTLRIPERQRLRPPA